jgi:hypothetical protein
VGERLDEDRRRALRVDGVERDDTDVLQAATVGFARGGGHG